MATIKLKKGYDLNLAGGIASDGPTVKAKSKAYAIVPDDFHGIIPRLEKAEGSHVIAGEALFHDKDNEAIKVTSPVSGTVAKIVRGERRKILAIVIEPDSQDESKKFKVSMSNPIETLLDSGLWTMIRQRPYDVVPSPDERPRDIFVTCFDSAPLAPSLTKVAGDDTGYIQKGIDVLAKLTNGNVHLGCRKGDVPDVSGAIITEFDGPHPAGNAGIQVANVSPVNKGDIVWTLDIVTMARIGHLFATSEMNYDTTVAVTGSEVAEPRYVKAVIGCDMSSLVDGNIKSRDGIEPRVISGNVLTGQAVGIDGYLRAPYRQVTVIPEVAQKDEFMGWASLNPNKFSIYRNFTGWLLRRNKKPAELDARLKGGKRAIVLCGEYDRMLPMDIYAEFLIKSIIAFDIDKMEQLGIYEVAPEDFALAEYADTSKLELQQIVRDGLDRMRKEMC